MNRIIIILGLLSACVADSATSDDPVGEVVQAVTGTFDDVNVNSANESTKLGVRGNGDQVMLENSDGGSRLKVASNGSGSYWNMSVLPASGSDDVTIGLFQDTTTSGALRFDMIDPNGMTGVRLSPRGTSFIDPYVAGDAKILSLGHLVPEAVIDARDPGNYHAESVVTGRFDSTSFFNNSSGARSGTAVRASARNYRTSGSGRVANYAIWADAVNGDDNYAIWVERGAVSLGNHYVSKGTTPTLSSCGTDAFIQGNDTSGFVVVGDNASACTVTFSQAWTGQSYSPDCMWFNQNGKRVTTSSSSTALTATEYGGDDISGTYNRYFCFGRENPPS